MSSDDGNKFTHVRRLHPWKTHRRHFSAADISQEAARVVWQERTKPRQEATEDLQPVDCGFYYPAPSTEKKVSKKTRKASRSETKRRKTHYKPFNEDEFGERLCPQPLEKQKSLLAALTCEEEEEGLKAMMDFRFPAQSVSKERLT
jgi:hypothetical protein